MMKGTNIQDFIANLPEDEQDAINAEYSTLKVEYMVLQEIRKISGLSQAQLANVLKMDQSNLSKLEKREDVYISTLRRYIEAVGGKLHIMAALPNKPLVELTGFSSLRTITK